MRKPIFTKQFQKDYKKLERSGINLRLSNFIDKTISKLIKEESLNPTYHDHALKGEWQDCRECHIQGNWLLIYRITKNNEIYFERTGSHAELFN